MKIIEFVGVPGAGKTTACNLLEQELHKQGFRVLNLHVFELHENLYKKVIRKYIEKKSKTSIINREFNRRVNKLELSSEIDIYEWIQNIQVMNYRIKKESSKYDFVLFDEGILQAITALYHGKRIIEKKEIESLINTFCKEYLSSTQIIDLDLDFEVVRERIINRNRTGDQFLNFDEEKMKSLFEDKKHNIHVVVDSSNFLIDHMDANRSVEMIVYDIIEMIK